MVTHRDRGRSMVHESLRRERRINDLLGGSGAARRSGPVGVGADDPEWRAAEREIRRIEHEIRRIDPGRPDFWPVYAELEARLIDRFADVGIDLAPPQGTA